MPRNAVALPRLGAIRTELGIDVTLLAAYFAVERRRYPHAPESRRLLD